MMNCKETIKFLPVVLKTRLVPMLLGHTGIGKTEIIQQYCEKNSMDCVVIHVAQLEPSDFVGLYKTTPDGRTMNCPPNWLPYREMDKEANPDQKLSDLLPKEGQINPNGGIIFLDEINRGHEDIRQALYQFLTTKRLHTYALPEKYYIVAAANPFDGYEVYTFDKALVNRFAWIRFRPDFDETKEYLTNKFGRNHLLSWVDSNKSLVEYGDDEFKVDGMTYSPRMLENSIKMYNELQNEPQSFVRKCFETVMAKEKVQSLLSFLEELKYVSYKDILAGKKKDKVQELVDKKRVDVISTLTIDLADHFNNSKGSFKKEEAKNVTDFLMGISDEIVTVFLDAVKTYGEKGSIEQDEYFRTNLKKKLGKYKKVFE